MNLKTKIGDDCSTLITVLFAVLERSRKEHWHARSNRIFELVSKNRIAFLAMESNDFELKMVSVL